MIIFLTLLAKIIPLYVVILIGFLSGKLLKVHKESLAKILLYIIVPAVMLQTALTTRIAANTLSLPILPFLIGTAFAIFFYHAGKFFYKDATRNILAFTSGTANVGYFGLPVAILLFPPEVVNFYVLAILGSVVYQNSVGFYITASSHHSPREALVHVLTLPTLYAFALGIALNLGNFPLRLPMAEFLQNFRGAYAVLGMMMVGLGIADMKRLAFDGKFISLAFFAKFLLWPAAMIGIIFLDQTIFHFFTPQIHHVLLLYSLMPMAADTVSVATLHRAEPEKAALAVFLSTLLALISIPLVVSLFGI
ncbi:transporter [Candidatus Gottesmanbacteria bacterium]|nr:transporter [Candidatus Gottesmanbacteria bacterium]